MSPNRSTIPLVLPQSTSSPSRPVEWLRRYGPAEVVGLATAVLGSSLAWALSGNEIAAAYGGSLGENVGFYGVIVGREIWTDRRSCRASGATYGFRGCLRTAMNLGLEFGAAELLDSLVIRPLAMGVAAQYLGRRWGIIAGKFVSDVTFYVPVVISYELRRIYRRSSSRS